jgi:hypothetical protein
MDANGRTLDGDFDRTSEGTPLDDYTWDFSFGPANDDFRGAMELAGATGSLRAGTTNMTMELDEPLGMDLDPTGAATVWYQWRASEDGWMTFDTSSGTTLDSLVAIYEGSDLASLREVGYSEGFGSRSGGRVSLPVQAGANYYVCVGGQTYWGPVNGYLGSFTLSWYPTPEPSFTVTQFAPRTGPPGATIILSGTNFTGATAVNFGGVPATFATGISSNQDVRITAKVPSDVMDGLVTIHTPYGTVTSTVPFTVSVPALEVTTEFNLGPAVSWNGTTPLIRLQSLDDLGSGDWKDVEGGLEQSNGRTYLRGAALGQKRFYRLKK